MELTQLDIETIASGSLIDAVITAEAAAPTGWCVDFDASHDYIPAWAMGGDTPSERFVSHCRSKGRAAEHALAVSLRRWLAANPECPELRARVADVRQCYAERETWPDGWRQFAGYFTDSVPY